MAQRRRARGARRDLLKDRRLVQEPERIAPTNLLSEPLIVYEKSTDLHRFEGEAEEVSEAHDEVCARVVPLGWGG